MKPEDYAKTGTEYSHQVALFMWANMNIHIYPYLNLMFSIKNEEKSGSKVIGGKFKASGVKAGVPDIFLPVPSGLKCGLFIEMKKIGGKPTKEQIDFGEKVEKMGYVWRCCQGWEDAKNTIIKYLEGEIS